MSADTPTISLELDSRPENLSLVRGMLGGVGDLLALDAELLDDVKTAVSEAANNVVVHAYEDEPGPLLVSLALSREQLAVSVLDRGAGIDSPPSEHELGLGLPVIQALAQRAELRSPPEGGTEVWMAFAGQRDGVSLYGVPLAPSPPDGWTDRHAGDVKVSVSPVPLVAGVLGRLARALAAHAHFSLDRFSDVYLVSDSLAVLAERLAAAPRIGFCLEASPRRLLITLGPLRPGTGEALAEESDPVLGSRSPLALLSDELTVEPDGGEARLRVLLVDRR